MSSKDDSAMRKQSSVSMPNKTWPAIDEDDVSGTSPIYYYHALGKTIVRWNKAEDVFRHLVGYICRMKDPAAKAMLAHVGLKTLQESLLAISNSAVSFKEVQKELEYSEKLFERNRVNRNFIVHGATEMPSDSRSFSIGPNEGMVLNRLTARGKIKYQQWLIAINHLRSTADQINELTDYLGAVIDLYISYTHGKPSEPPLQPPLPEFLSKDHHLVV